MGFEFHPFMLVFVAGIAFASYILLNHRKVNEMNRRRQERSRLPKVLLPSHWDPDGSFNRIGAAGMILIGILCIIGIGTGLMEV